MSCSSIYTTTNYFILFCPHLKTIWKVVCPPSAFVCEFAKYKQRWRVCVHLRWKYLHLKTQYILSSVTCSPTLGDYVSVFQLRDSPRGADRLEKRTNKATGWTHTHSALTCIPRRQRVVVGVCVFVFCVNRKYTSQRKQQRTFFAQQNPLLTFVWNYVCMKCIVCVIIQGRASSRSCTVKVEVFAHQTISVTSHCDENAPKVVQPAGGSTFGEGIFQLLHDRLKILHFCIKILRVKLST